MDNFSERRDEFTKGLGNKPKNDNYYKEQLRGLFFSALIFFRIFDNSSIIAYSTNNIETTSGSELLGNTMFNVIDDLPHPNSGMPGEATVQGIMKTEGKDGKTRYEVVNETVVTDDLYYVNLGKYGIDFNDDFYYVESEVSTKAKGTTRDEIIDGIRISDTTIPEGAIVYGAMSLSGKNKELFFWMDKEHNLIIGNLDYDNMRRVTYDGKEIWDVKSDMPLSDYLNITRSGDKYTTCYENAALFNSDVRGTVINKDYKGMEVTIPKGTMAGVIANIDDQYAIVEASVPIEQGSVSGSYVLEVEVALNDSIVMADIPGSADRLGSVYWRTYSDENNEEFVYEGLDEIPNFSDILINGRPDQTGENINAYYFDDDGELKETLVPSNFVSDSFGTPEERYWDLNELKDICTELTNSDLGFEP